MLQFPLKTITPEHGIYESDVVNEYTVHHKNNKSLGAFEKKHLGVYFLSLRIKFGQILTQNLVKVMTALWNWPHYISIILFVRTVLLVIFLELYPNVVYTMYIPKVYRPQCCVLACLFTDVFCLHTCGNVSINSIISNTLRTTFWYSVLIWGLFCW